MPPNQIGGGTLSISGAENSPRLTATGGVTNLATPLGTGNSAVTVAPASASGATVNFGSSQTLASLVIGNLGVVTLTASPAPGFAEALEPATPDLVTGEIGVAQAPELASGFEGLGEAGSSAAVPEPGSIGLLLAGALGFLARRRRS